MSSSKNMSGAYKSRNGDGRRIGNDGMAVQKPYVDWSLIIIIIYLLAFGLIILYSASYYEASMSKDDQAFYLKKQLMWDAIGVACMVGVSFFPYRFFKKTALPLFLISLAMIPLCMAFPATNGAHRWIYIGNYQVQPAEIVKITTILLMASMICRIGTAVNDRKIALKVLALPFIASVMLYTITNNLSSAIIVFLIAVGMFFVARPDYWRFILLAVLLLVLIAAGVWLIMNNTSIHDKLSFRADRITTWLNPEKSSSSSGFQTLQALYAIGSGGWFGKGLGKSMQKLGYIPEVQNDMIFSIVCEELGICGAIAIILMFILLCWRLMYIADNAQDAFGSFIVTGVFCHISIQVVLNIAVVTNTIPNTGVTLPFISYGGSSVIFTLAEIGIALNVARRIIRTDRMQRR